jgi:hypothetical protein
VSDDEDLDPVHLSAQLERMTSMLEITCQALEDQGLQDSIPDNAFDWWETLKTQRRIEAKRKAEVREELMLRAIAKLTPEELEALKG